MKASKAPKENVDKEVAKLLDLKKKLTVSSGDNAPAEKKKGGKKNAPVKEVAGNGDSNAK